MLKILPREEWERKVSGFRMLKLNEQLEVVNSLCSIFNFSAVHCIYERKGKCVITFIAFVKNKTIHAPIHFLYSPLWIDEQLNDLKFMEYLTSFISELQLLYHHISIRLCPGYSDVRPFLWNNFSVKNNYTYIKKLGSLSYQSVVKKNIEKAKELKLHFTEEGLTEESITLNLKIFKDLHFRSSKVAQVQKLITELASHHRLSCFNCYLEHQMIASMQVFLDDANQIAYLVLLNQSSSHERSNIHSALHDFLFETLSAKGYRYVDLMGGDFKGISGFKSSFNATLVPHFTLKYSRKISLVEKVKSNQISVIRKILAKF